MRTSIVISNVAAFILMLTLGFTPEPLNTSVRAISKAGKSTFIPASELKSAAASENSASATNTKKTSNLSTDLNYLKFDVSGLQTSSDESLDKLVVPETAGFEYLKFDVSHYLVVDENYESAILPASAETRIMKFDVSKFTSEADTYEGEELPIEFPNTLKFDVNRFSTDKNSAPDNFSELPDDEFNYLKFDVSNFGVQASESDYPSVNE